MNSLTGQTRRRIFTLDGSNDDTGLCRSTALSSKCGHPSGTLTAAAHGRLNAGISRLRGWFDLFEQEVIAECRAVGEHRAQWFPRLGRTADRRASRVAHFRLQSIHQPSNQPVSQSINHTHTHARTHARTHTHPFNGPFPGCLAEPVPEM